MEKIKVLDLSYVQQNVDFEKIKNHGVRAVIIRTGYLGKTDTMFHSHMKGAIDAGLDIGVYTYVISENAVQAAMEARQTLERIEEYKGYINYPVFCDMEHTKYYDTNKYSRKTRTDIIEAFCTIISDGGYHAGVYINPSWLEEWTEKSRIVGKYDIWLAAWTEDAEKVTRYNYGQTMWQWGTEKIDGITGSVDSNLCYVDYPSIIKESGRNYLADNRIIVAVKNIKNAEYDKTARELTAMGFLVYSECK